MRRPRRRPGDQDVAVGDDSRARVVEVQPAPPRAGAPSPARFLDSRPPTFASIFPSLLALLLVGGRAEALMWTLGALITYMCDLIDYKAGTVISGVGTVVVGGAASVVAALSLCEYSLAGFLLFPVLMLYMYCLVAWVLLQFRFLREEEPGLVAMLSTSLEVSLPLSAAAVTSWSACEWLDRPRWLAAAFTLALGVGLGEQSTQVSSRSVRILSACLVSLPVALFLALEGRHLPLRARFPQLLLLHIFLPWLALATARRPAAPVPALVVAVASAIVFEALKSFLVLPLGSSLWLSASIYLAAAVAPVSARFCSSAHAHMRARAHLSGQVLAVVASRCLGQAAKLPQVPQLAIDGSALAFSAFALDGRGGRAWQWVLGTVCLSSAGAWLFCQGVWHLNMTLQSGNAWMPPVRLREFALLCAAVAAAGGIAVTPRLHDVSRHSISGWDYVALAHAAGLTGVEYILLGSGLHLHVVNELSVYPAWCCVVTSVASLWGIFCTRFGGPAPSLSVMMWLAVALHLGKAIAALSSRGGGASFLTSLASALWLFVSLGSPFVHAQSGCMTAGEGAVWAAASAVALLVGVNPLLRPLVNWLGLGLEPMGLAAVMWASFLALLVNIRLPESQRARRLAGLALLSAMIGSLLGSRAAPSELVAACFLISSPLLVAACGSRRLQRRPWLRWSLAVAIGASSGGMLAYRVLFRLAGGGLVLVHLFSYVLGAVTLAEAVYGDKSQTPLAHLPALYVAFFSTSLAAGGVIPVLLAATYPGPAVPLEVWQAGLFMSVVVHALLSAGLKALVMVELRGDKARGVLRSGTQHARRLSQGGFGPAALRWIPFMGNGEETISQLI
jgi:hypothetical protein